MKIKLYHGCQNTFAITNYEKGINYNQEAHKVCELYHVDGFLVLKKEPLEMLFFNADGTRAPMCGNGLRCFIRFAYEEGIPFDEWKEILTLGGTMFGKITSYDPFLVLISLGKPSFSSKVLDIDTPKKAFLNEKIVVKGENFHIHCVFLGTHHAVIFVKQLQNLPGEEIHNLPIFKAKINVNFVQIRNRQEIFVKTYERGVGWTRSCGTGACSSFCIARLYDYVDNDIYVSFVGGKIRVKEMNGLIYMEGPAEEIKEQI